MSKSHLNFCLSYFQVTPAKTAELLAQFVASRTQPPKTKDEAKVEVTKKEEINVKKHTPLPKATEDLTQPIMYIDKKTGVLSVDMMWTCTKCSFAYNKVEDNKCEVCRVQRQMPKDDMTTGPDGDFQLVTQVNYYFNINVVLESTEKSENFIAKRGFFPQPLGLFCLLTIYFKIKPGF